MKKNKTTLLILIIPALFFQFIGASLYFLNFFSPITNQILYTITKLTLLIWPLLYFYYLPKTKKQEKPQYKQSILYGLSSGIIFASLIFLLYISFSNYFQLLRPLIYNKVNDLNVIQYYILFSIFLSFIHSFLEEYYWRIFLHKGLSKIISYKAAFIIGGLAFSSHHFIIIAQIFPLPLTIFFGISIAISGAFWAYLYDKTNTIIGSWLSHVCVDIIIMYIGYILIF